jgi:hypothetical protein
MERTLKISLALLLFLCLLPFPYGYFQFVRFAAMVGFGYLALQAQIDKNELGFWIYGALALLFQPFFKIALGREAWNVIDVIVGVGLLVSLRKK